MERVKEKNQVWQKQICMKSPLYRHHSGLSIFSLLQLQGPPRGQETPRQKRTREGKKKRAMSDCSQTERLKSFELLETKPKFCRLALFLFPYGHTVITVTGNHTSLPSGTAVNLENLCDYIVNATGGIITSLNSIARGEELLVIWTLQTFKTKIWNESVKRKKVLTRLSCLISRKLLSTVIILHQHTNQA